MSSFTDLAGTLAWTTSRNGAVPSFASGAKALMGSYGVFWVAASVAYEDEARISV
jgi:hypothetical protein